MHSMDHSLLGTYFRAIDRIVHVAAIAIATAACFSMPQKNPHPDRLQPRI
jgi:hypothetical protein